MFIKIQWDNNYYQKLSDSSAKSILTGNEVTLTGVPYEEVDCNEVVNSLTQLITNVQNLQGKNNDSTSSDT